MPYINQSAEDVASATAFTSLLKARIISRPFASVTVKNLHSTQILQYKVLVTDDATGTSGWAEDKAATDINGNTSARHVLSGPFVWVDIQIASKGAGEAPHGSAYLTAVGL